MSSLKLLDDIRKGSKWYRDKEYGEKDVFPSSCERCLEIQKWLEFLNQNCQYNKFKPRLQGTHKQRDKTLAEVKASYFISEILGYKIAQWEPKGNNGKTLEFSFKVDKGIEIFCEVKSPGWERAEVEKKDFNRINEQKYKEKCEVKYYDNKMDIILSIQKASQQFKEEEINMLIIVDDLWVSNKVDRYHGIKCALFNGKDGCFTNSNFIKLSAIANLNIDVMDRKIVYTWKVFRNPNAKIELPKNFDKENYIYEVHI